ncbi:MAG: PspC domain-containing protein [Candidatus Limnocylindria bacterium]
MTSQDTNRTHAPGRLLRRRTADRVIGGVAGGLGDYFNVDPLLFRIGFVGLIIFGGAGLVLYIIGWLLLPAEGQDVSMAEGFLRRLALTPRRIGWIALAVIVFLLFTSAMNSGGAYSLNEGPLGIPGAFWALGVMVAGVLLLRRHEAVPAGAPESAAAAQPRAAQPRAAPLRAAPRPRSPLGWYVVAAMLVGTGLLALVGRAAGVEVSPGQFFGAALAIVGIGLVIGAWWGRARILILIALLLLPLGVTASFVTAPLEGGVGVPRFTPANAAELRDEYRLMSGTLTVDLSELSVGTRSVDIGASVAVGQLVVILPRDASVELRARAGAGQVTIFNDYHAGTSLDDVYVRHHKTGTTYILDLEVGIGEVLVITNIGGDY